MTAVAAREPTRAETYAASHGIPKVHADYEALLSDANIDLIYVSTPPSTHEELALACIAAGKPALVEKPFALNASEASRVHNAAIAAGVPVWEAMHSPHHALFRRILALLSDGKVGAVERIEAQFSVPISADDPFRWSGQLGGGALMDLGVYPLAWVRRIAGEDFHVLDADRILRGDVDASFSAQLAYASGTEALISSSMTAASPTAILKVYGSNGELEAINPVAPQIGHSLRISDGDAEHVEQVAGPGSYDEQLAAVVATLKSKAPFPFRSDDYVMSMRAIDSIRAKFA